MKRKTGKTPAGLVEIMTDGKTVWINGPDGGNLGRFGSMRLDIHCSAEEQIRRGKQCLHCKKGYCDRFDWETFRAKMREHHGVLVPESFRPEYLN